jgi:Transposase domain (DUF772)
MILWCIGEDDAAEEAQDDGIERSVPGAAGPDHLLKHIYGLSDEGVCERWVHDPYFQFFTGRRVLPARLPA